MKVRAKLSYLRIAPRKVRLVADLIRGKSVEEAETILNFTTKKAAFPIFKLLRSAIANAKNNFQLDPANLYIFRITVDEGPKYKRWQARARGQAAEIQKKTSHITLVLDELVKKPSQKKRIKEMKLEKVKVGEKKVEEKKPKEEKPKFKPEIIIPKPKIEKGLKRIFRRKAF